jgi:deoxyadenosine/deoxycytidine kinase
MKVYIEANIGCGKTTFLQMLKDRLGDKINIIKEPVDEWTSMKDEEGKDILVKYYGDMRRWSFTFQINSLSSRLNKFLEQYDKNKINFIERSIYSDRNCFAQLCHKYGNMDKLELHQYEQLFKLMDNNISISVVPDVFIYLKVNSKTCHDRINERSRDGEGNIPITYLDDLCEMHEIWMKENKKNGINILEIDADVNFRDDIKVQNECIDTIMKYLDNVK